MTLKTTKLAERLDKVVAEIRLEAKDQTEAGEDASVLRDWANRVASSARELEAALSQQPAVDEDDLLKLQQFAADIIGDGELGSWDGGDIQDMAEACGLLVPTEVTEACSEETCACAGYGEDFPMTCYRHSPTLLRAYKAAALHQGAQP